MGEFSVWHWLVVLIVYVIPALLMTQVSRRAGLSSWWFVVWLIPILQWIGLWVFAFSRWPSVDPTNVVQRRA